MDNEDDNAQAAPKKKGKGKSDMRRDDGDFAEDDHEGHDHAHGEHVHDENCNHG